MSPDGMEQQEVELEYLEPGLLTEFEEDEAEEENPLDKVDWLKLSNQSYDDSTSFLDKGLRSRWEKNYSLAMSRHPSGSKYYSDVYKHRSRQFRGKTQAAIRRNMAGLAIAMFSTRDVVSITAETPKDEAQGIAAKGLDSLSNYHFTTDIPWFQLSVGALREALTNGIVCAKYWWDYEDAGRDPDTGEIKVLSDKPVIDLLPIENCRISPAADWIDPVNSSPYFIILWPMFVGDVKDRMETGEYLEHTDDKIAAAKSGDIQFDTTRRARDAHKADGKAEDATVADHEIVWVREVFIRKMGLEFHYYTLGQSALLTKPQLLEDSYPHCSDGKRPVVLGTSEIEPHNIYVQGLPERVEGMQVSLNDLTNQRKDNVELVLNRRHIAQRGKNVDYRALQRSIPGGIILTDDMNAVKPENMPDVTGSSFHEQDRLNMDFDELAGTFSTASVATQRQLNETVGGMQLLQGNSNILAEFQLKVMVETFFEKLVRGIVRMIQVYEEDDVIQAVTGNPELTSEALQASVNVTVDIGFGATNPQQRVERLMYGLTSLAKLFPDLQTDVDRKEIANEVFGALGWKDGGRFLPGLDQGENPQVEQLKEQMQQMQQQMEQMGVELKFGFQLAQAKLEAERDIINLKGQWDLELAGQAQRLELMRLASKENIKMAEIKAMLEKLDAEIAGKRTLLADETKVKVRFGSGL